jgi:transaldolase
VTTNPLLLERAGQACTLDNLGLIAAQVSALGAREVQMQVWGRSTDQMTATGRQLAALATQRLAVTVKVPATETGFEVAQRLRAEAIPVTMTAVYTVGQVLLAAGLGAAYAAPYLGRLNDAGQPGHQMILDMAEILRRVPHGPRLLVASLREARQVVELARNGLDTFTFGAPVAAALLASDLTAQAAAAFQTAAENMDRPGTAD